MNFETYKNKICDYFNVSWVQLENKNNSSRVSNARNFTYYTMHYHLGMSISKIAKEFNRTDRGIKQRIADLKFLIENHKKYKKQYDELILLLEDA